MARFLCLIVLVYCRAVFADHPCEGVGIPNVAAPSGRFIQGSSTVKTLSTMTDAKGHELPQSQEITVAFNAPEMKDGKVHIKILQGFPNEDGRGRGSLVTNFKVDREVLKAEAESFDGRILAIIELPISYTISQGGNWQPVPRYNVICVEGVSYDSLPLFVTPAVPCLGDRCQVNGAYAPGLNH